MQRTGSTAELPPPPNAHPREPFLRWFGGNVMRLAVYLGIVSVALGVLLVVGDGFIEAFDAGSGMAVVLFLSGALYGIPGTTVWLLIVSRLPSEWSITKRRLVALAATPLIQIFWLVVFVLVGWIPFALLFGLLLPAGSAFVVRLRERMPSLPFSPEGPAVQPFPTATG
jgi:hypothetical protein